MTRKAWSDNKWPQPVLSERMQPDEILMTLSVDNGGADFGKDGIKDGIKELTERQLVVLKLIEADGTITTHDLTQKTGMSQTQKC